MAKIVLYSLEVVGKQMAGPGIRYWEFAKALSKEHTVTLLTPNVSALTSSSFAIKTYRKGSITPEMRQADIIITQSIPLRLALAAHFNGTKLILDAYDPLPLEGFEMFKSKSLKDQNYYNNRLVKQQNLSFLTCDAVICASEKQRDLWVGALMALERLTPSLYAQDNSLRQFIDVVPFGLPTHLPVRSGDGLRKLFGFKESDKIILWGGGIWNWFDPLSLIKAMQLISAERDDIKLVFMGIKNPSTTVPEMEMNRRAIDLAKELDLFERSVFFNFGWVPYEERQNFLLDASIGASIHADHLETRYSFRTRMLDYIWCELPILATTGDSFADLIQQHNLGIVVPYQDSQAIAKAIKRLVDDPQLVAEIKGNLRNRRDSFQWDTLVKPLSTMAHQLSQQPPHRFNLSKGTRVATTYVSLVNTIRKEKGTFSLLKSKVSKEKA